MKSITPKAPRARPVSPNLGHFSPLTPAARAASLEAAWAERDDSQGIWVFGYGSLMWSPCFTFTEQRRAALPGFRRSFCIWTTLARGTPAAPGLGVGLEATEGACPGIAFRLDPDTLDQDLEILWAREMHTGVYRARWLPLETAPGPLRALCFVVDPAHRQYAGELPPARQAEIISRAAGKYGTCRDYLAELVTALGKIAIDDPELADLLTRVDAALYPKQPDRS